MQARTYPKLDLKTICNPTGVVSTQNSANLHEKVQLINVC